MEITFKPREEISSSTAIFLMSEDMQIPNTLQGLDSDNIIQNALSMNSKSFSGKCGQTFKGFIQTKNGIKSIIVMGIGSAEKVDELCLLNTGGRIADIAQSLKLEVFDLVVEKFNNMNIEEPKIASQLMFGMQLKNYKFNKYFTTKQEEHKLYIKSVAIRLSEPQEAVELAKLNQNIVDGVYLTRDLVSEPSNTLYPATFANVCKDLEKLGVKVSIFDKDQMKNLGMNLLLGVAKGSAHDPYMVVMEWKGDPNSEGAPLSFLGKGVTFDSGGINIKTSNSISDMKYDMGGAGVVTGLMHTLAARKAKVNVIGAIGLVENMPSGTAQKPSDVVKSMSGQTVEVDNTDAEGRLVLADVLCYVEQNYKPKFMIDLATLTGAIVVALGDGGHAGLFSNNDDIANAIFSASQKTGELVWRLPMSDHYDKQINSEIADVRNTGTGYGGGSITAAQFLARFVNKCPWAHLDIAGMTWNKRGTDILPKGATGFGVRLLNQFVMDNYEQS